MKKYAFAFFALFIFEAAGGLMQGLLGGAAGTSGQASPDHGVFVQEGTDPSGMSVTG